MTSSPRTSKMDAIWEEFRAGKLDIVTASFVTYFAIEFVRLEELKITEMLFPNLIDLIFGSNLSVESEGDGKDDFKSNSSFVYRWVSALIQGWHQMSSSA